MKDFYDLYILPKICEERLDVGVLKNAVAETFDYRNCVDLLDSASKILDSIENSSEILQLWNDYLATNKYIGQLEFNDVFKSVRNLVEKLLDS